MAKGYVCVKCGHNEYKTGEIRTTGGFWSKIFDVQTKRFTTITCKRCGYTELYARNSSTLGNIFDFLTN